MSNDEFSSIFMLNAALLFYEYVYRLWVNARGMCDQLCCCLPSHLAKRKRCNFSCYNCLQWKQLIQKKEGLYELSCIEEWMSSQLSTRAVVLSCKLN